MSRSKRANRERASECLTEARECLELIKQHSEIGFPVSKAVVNSCLKLSEMYAVYMTEPGGDFGDISERR